MNDKCVCTDQYTDKGDFSLGGGPCDIFIPAIYALWSIVVCLALVNIFAAIWAMISSKNHLQLRAWRSWSMSLYSLLHSAILIAMAVDKFTDMESNIIGKDVFITSCHALFIISCGGHLFIALLGFIRANELTKIAGLGPELRRKYSAKIQRLNLILLFVYLLLWPFIFLPFVLLSHPESVTLIAALHGTPLALAFLTLGAYMAPRLMTSMAKAIELSTMADASKQEQLDRIAYKLRFVRAVALFGFPFASIVVLLFAWWPYFTAKAAYALPLIYCIALFATIIVMWGTITTAENNIRRMSFPLFRRFFKHDTPDIVALGKGRDLERTEVHEMFTEDGGARTEDRRGFNRLPETEFGLPSVQSEIAHRGDTTMERPRTESV